MERRFSKEVEDFLSEHTVMLGKYFFVPYWYEKLDNGNFIPHPLDKPKPRELEDAIRREHNNNSFRLNPEELKKLRSRYERAVEEKEGSFDFGELKFDTGYAKYFIEYWEGRYKAERPC